MDIDTLEDLAKELKNDENEAVIALFEEYAKTHNIDEEKLEQVLSKEHDYQESIFLNDVHKLKNIDYEELTKNVDKKEIGKIINLAQINALTDTCKKVMKP